MLVTLSLLSVSASARDISENMEADPRVRLRVDGVIYELRAERVTDAAEMDAFAEAWLELGAWARDPRGYDEVFVYRLVAR